MPSAEFDMYNIYPADAGRVNPDIKFYYITPSLKKLSKSEFRRLAHKVFLNHKSNLEGYSVVKLTQIKSR